MNFLFKGVKRKYLLMLIDFACISFCCFMSSMLLTFFKVIYFNPAKNVWDIAIFSLLSVIGLCLVKTYRVVWRYAQLRNFVNCMCGVLFGLAAYLSLCVYAEYETGEVNFIFSAFVSMVALCVMRIIYAYLHAYLNGKDLEKSGNRVMIVGAGEGGRHICNLMMMDRKSFAPVVFVDDDAEKVGRFVGDVPVKGTTADIPFLVDKMGINEIVIAIPSIKSSDKTRILNICSETLCKVSTLPQLKDYVHSDNLIKQMKPIRIEDLLGRDVVDLDDRQIRDMICNKTCMITGGGGSIGSELTRQIAKMNPKKLIIVDIYENNAYDIQQELRLEYADELDVEVQIASVRDNDKMEAVFDEFRPELVFHAAAHKHVPLMETNPEEAVKNNIFGTLNVAGLAKKYEAQKFVLVSTDKAVNPTNIMGATKRCCEMIVECMSQGKSKTEFVAVRFGNVLGSNGSVIPLFERQISSGGPITVTDPEIIRYFMTIPEAAALILQAATMARGGEIFVLDMGEPVKILQLAENLVKLHGYRPYKDIEIKFTGLRPGEKLFEELLMDEEGLKNTANEKIFIGKQIKVNEGEFFELLSRLKSAADNNDKILVESLLMEIVPTFVRNNQETENKVAQSV